MLTLDHLTIRQSDFGLAADWTLPPRSFCAVIGPSGGGKSTLLLAIAGFLPLASGRVLWEGQDLAGQPAGKRPMSMLFQDQNLFPHLSLQQNLGLGLTQDLRLSAPDQQRIEAVLDRVGLAGLGARKPSQLSGGQQGRAALARALLRARPLLLLDEPFAALGPALKAEMLALVRDVAAETGATVLMVTHDPSDALRFADQTVLVAEGQAQPPRDTAALFADPPKPLRDYLG